MSTRKKLILRIFWLALSLWALGYGTRHHITWLWWLSLIAAFIQLAWTVYTAIILQDEHRRPLVENESDLFLGGDRMDDQAISIGKYGHKVEGRKAEP